MQHVTGFARTTIRAISSKRAKPGHDHKATKDKQAKKVNNKLRMNSRHSRFMGTYVATNMKSINDDNNLIVHKQARNMGDLLDDQSKIGVKKSKNKYHHKYHNTGGNKEDVD